jgi:ketopantoate reductase
MTAVTPTTLPGLLSHVPDAQTATIQPEQNIRIPILTVELHARGPHLHAMRTRGRRVTSVDGDFEVRPQTTGDLASVGTADVVFLGVKARGLSSLAPQQDWEAGLPMELEAVGGAVVELGERLGVPMPSPRAVSACAKLLDAHRGQRVLAKVEGVAS